MCGVVGFFGQPHGTHDRMFVDLLTIDAVRGKHSTGAAFIEQSGKIADIHKLVGTPTDLEIYTDFHKSLARSNIGLIGHNRYATRGKVTEENAHPFRHGHIVGCHNGTIDKWKFENHLAFETDSEAMIHSISKIGIEATYKLIQGPATVIFYNARERSMNFITNGDRPLYFGVLGDNKGVVWASERWMIQAMLERHSIKLTEQGILKPVAHVLFRWTLGKKGSLNQKTTKLEAYTPPAAKVWTNTNRTNLPPFVLGPQAQVGAGVNSTTQTTTNKPVVKTETETRLLTIPEPKHPLDSLVEGDEWNDEINDTFLEAVNKGDSPRNPISVIRKVPSQNLSFTKKEWDDTFRSGCVFCGEHVDFRDGDAMVIDKHNVACSSCAAIANANNLSMANAIR